MKILFLENRYKTFLYDAVIPELDDKVETHWIVQNPLFRPKNGLVHKIPFPKKTDLKSAGTDFREIEGSDRQLTFFENNSDHYSYYYNAIVKILTDVKPSVVFGEATAFHELMTIKACKELEISYLSPLTCRYPAQRFSFYKNDVLVPFSGSEETFEYDKATDIIFSIADRKVKPDYMKKIKESDKMKVFQDKFLKLYGYISGEKYNTPSPKVKKKLEANISKLEEEFNSKAKSIDSSKYNILYPMQMQPESNIDVYGRKHRDQVKTIKGIIDQLRDDENLVIKLNPKSKYELNQELVDVLSNPKVVGLNSKTPMEAVFPEVDIVVTVTGTIAMECIMSDKPVITLVKTLNNEQEICKYADSLNEIRGLVDSFKIRRSSSLTDDKVHYINSIVKTSFQGIISDPYSDTKCVSKENISNLAKAFNKVINEV